MSIAESSRSTLWVPGQSGRSCPLLAVLWQHSRDKLHSDRFFQQHDPVIAQIHKRIQPKDRLKHVWDKAKGKTVCQPDEVPKEDEEPTAVDPFGHGGCGHAQPVIRKEGLKLFVVYKKGKEEEEVSHTSALIRGRHILVRIYGN